ncbi:MAG: TRAP transporter small permease [Deltaproteobacteria bacterium]|jgi:C4-dicarboxylate transporter DctQ subunit|nr:TRAP transporter small permease [Deltaproteobacteria bacterium]
MFYRLLSRAVEGLIILGATTIVSIVTTEVVLRYLFKHSLIFTEELSRYLMVWIVFLGSALAVRDGSHIHINFLTKRFNPQNQVWLRLSAHILTLVFLVFIAVEGIKILPQQLYQMCITIDLSLFYFYLAIPVGSILMIIFLLPTFKDIWKEKISATDDKGEKSAC